MNTTFKTGIVIGACVAIAGLAVWFNISLSNTVSSDHAVLGQIVTLINNSQKQASGSTTAPANTAPTGK